MNLNNSPVIWKYKSRIVVVVWETWVSEKSKLAAPPAGRAADVHKANVLPKTDVDIHVWWTLQIVLPFSDCNQIIF